MVDTSNTHTKVFTRDVMTGTDVAEFADVKVGDIVEVKAEGNVTTGFNWYAINTEGLKLLKPLNLHPEYKTGEYAQLYNDGRMGSPGVSTFKFEVSAEGSEEVVIEYKRAWEVGVPSAKNITIKVKTK